ncbi:ABC transporter permease [Baekduia sp. Peel2402]|uniref:ABC transporter permease n=1 Tax=Baekduia sp. Peel2402 TaxID=3458296 RepID=UPI00403E8671
MSTDLSASTTPAVETGVGGPTSRRRSGDDVWRWLGRYGALAVLVGMIVIVALMEPDTFATKDNVINILNQSALAAIVAMGVTFPLVAGEFDLSVGNTASLSGVVACTLMEKHGFGIPEALILTVLIGVVIGLVNGFVVTAIGVNALVATLGIGTIVIGLNYAIAQGLPVTITGDKANTYIDLTLGKFLGIPYPVYIMLVLGIVLWTLLNRTVAGQAMQAVGGNPVAARLSGVRVDRIRVAVFVLAGACAALTGVLLASRTGSASVNGGDTYLLSAYAAAFFGSAVLRDGQFHIVGTIVGVVTVAVGFNAIALIGLGTHWQYLFQGGLLILGVGVGTLARRRTA